MQGTLDPLTRRQAAYGFADLATAVVIFCVGVWIGAHAVQAFRAAGGHQSFYQSEFGPAVMLTCGRGLQNPDTRSAPPLDAFLSERTDAVDCADLPPAIPVTGLDPFQRASRYLQVAVALTWKMTGVSWSRLAILPGALFGAVAALTYGLFRLGLSRLFALLGMVPTLMSTPNLMLVPHIRDYAKGPFLLAVIFIMGLLVVGPTDRWRAIALSALAGIVVGLGLGFRTDLALAVPPFLVTVAFLLPAVSIRMRMAAIAVFLTSFAVVASPLLRDYSNGNNIGLVTLLGLTAPFDQSLGIQPSVYEFGGQYNDSLIFTIINSYAIRVENRRQGVDFATPEYGRTSMKYLGRLAAVFPADLVTRTCAATRAVPTYFLGSSLYPPMWVGPGLVRGLYRVRGSVSSRLAPVGVAAVATAIIAISMADPRAAWLLILIMIGFAGASAIQFHERHFYYLQLVPWWAFGFLAQVLMRAPTLAGAVTIEHVKRAIVVCVTVCVAAGGAILLSRAYQQRVAAGLFEGYEAAPRTPLPLVRRPAGPGRTLIAAQDWLNPLPPGGPRIQARFLAVRFRGDLCGPANLALTIRYQATLPELDLSEPMTVKLHQGSSLPTTLFLVAYDRPDDSSRFRGVEVATEQAGCIDGFSRIEGLDHAPLLLTTMLAADWRRASLYQRLR